MAIWGGVECTVNRIHDQWFDQLVLSGHDLRIDDLDFIADLGIRTLRFPLLWERTVDASGTLQWEWADQRLMRLRELGIRPIIGLLHHGSGPKFTHLLDAEFAPRLANFAAQVAARYPWVTDYTPINEPLTTARFSALYGHWYPHRRDNRSFCRAFLNQCRGIVLAMRAIRSVNSEARLIQTEDLGTTYSTQHMAYQRDFDNERRWLTWDVLSGAMRREHPLATYFLQSSCTWPELDWFARNPCPPEVIGVNHYVTSDRFLDERVSQYAGEPSGSNSIDEYVDVPAVRVLPGEYRGWQVLENAWRRYGIPLALTEVHLGCTREEQLRWFHDAWNAAAASRDRGCDVIAVTSWALFGSYNWDNLLTQNTGSYESGAFDCRSPVPRPTAVAHMIRRLCASHDAIHPSMRSRGWWQRPSKLIYLGGAMSPLNEAESKLEGPPCLLVVGAENPFTRALIRACALRYLPVELMSPVTLSVLSALQIEALCRRLRPWAIIDAGSRADATAYDADRSPEARHHGILCESVAAVAAAPIAKLIHTRSFDGESVDGPASQFDSSTARSVLIELFGSAEKPCNSSHWGQLADACLDLMIDEADGIYRLAVRNNALSPLYRVGAAPRGSAKSLDQGFGSVRVPEPDVISR